MPITLALRFRPWGPLGNICGFVKLFLLPAPNVRDRAKLGLLMGTSSITERANILRDRAEHLLKLAELQPSVDGRAALYLSLAYGYHQMGPAGSIGD